MKGLLNVIFMERMFLNRWAAHFGIKRRYFGLESNHSLRNRIMDAMVFQASTDKPLGA